MMIRNTRHLRGLGALIAASGLALAACDDGATTTTTTGDPSATLEIAGFALTEDDQSDDGFDQSADTTTLEEEVADELDEDGEVPPSEELDAEPPAEGPDHVARTVLVAWGQRALNPALAETPTAWNGQIHSERAAFRVLRAVRFEREIQGDRLVRDEDPRMVSFETTTTVHHDGLLLRVIMPRDVATLGGELVFETEHFVKAIPLRVILAGETVSFEADDLGNELLVASSLPSRCPHGLVRLHWERKSERGGVFGGRFIGADGAVRGKVVGIWGTVGDKRRFKGVFRDEAGAFQGTVRGAWTPLPEAAGGRGGAFRGVWVSPSGEVRGVMGGVFRVGDEPGEGGAAGFWRVACGAGPGDACAADLALPEPPPMSCACAEDVDNGLDEACACEAAPPPTCVPPEEPVAAE
ncbi:MAG: hypothetical protein IT385_12780 [Deltaproteobacteria bacterium]|nr:hypothetical protein [Deltaproteobacteria bacterium]